VIAKPTVSISWMIVVPTVVTIVLSKGTL
jgi:hypothetical protein